MNTFLGTWCSERGEYSGTKKLFMNFSSYGLGGEIKHMWVLGMGSRVEEIISPKQIMFFPQQHENLFS